MTESGTHRRKGRPKTFDRERLVGLAMELYWREGTGAISLNELCRRASLSKPTLYREFGDEDGLMAAVLDLYRAQVLHLVYDAIETEAPFEAMVEHLIVGMTMDHGTPPGCLFTEMRFLRERLGPKARARLAELEEERYHAFASWFRGALARQEANAAVSPEMAGRFVDTQCTAMLLQTKNGEPVELIREQARMAFRALFSIKA